MRTSCNFLYRPASSTSHSRSTCCCSSSSAAWSSIHGAFLGAAFLIAMPQLISLSKDWLPDAIGQAPGLPAVVYSEVPDRPSVLFEPLNVRTLAEDAHLAPADVSVLPAGHVQAAEEFPEIGSLEMNREILPSADQCSSEAESSDGPCEFGLPSGPAEKRSEGTRPAGANRNHCRSD